MNIWTIYYSDDTHRDFKANSVIEAWIRGMSCAFIKGDGKDIAHIINCETCKIYSDFDWDISFSLRDAAFISGSHVKYTELEVQSLLDKYARYVGNTVLKADEWFQRNKKLR